MKAYRIPTNIFKDVLDKGQTLQDKVQAAFNVELTKKSVKRVIYQSLRLKEYHTIVDNFPFQLRAIQVHQ